MNVETVSYKNIEFTTFDMGGRDPIRALWRHYYQNTQGIIFVVDSNDKDRMGSPDESYFDWNARDVLHEMLGEDALKGVPILVFANKQDLPKSAKVDEVKETLGLNQLRKREW
eukprot:CAMPEP_0201567290 /NCGR_PEP_ID=MMETSP0190_2-20130828/7743_1 /ASSEMBLY_ACC=CAM_ASM_000263 /TAXON_ID=37353 /ORGANISM="Rosalina sp." /LENGTH=112 /DNA_ID=CAMNT_0047987123 /DNA_START=191 /DNA_END=526 /DNA_ORIENTATION=+